MERKWRALIIVCVAVFMLLLDITVVNVALPSIQRDLHTSFTDLQWVVDAYALLLATCMLNAGTLGDLFGRKRIFIGGVALFTLASALCGSATSPLFLNLARGLQGVGGAAMFAVSLAIISQEFQGRERGTAFGIWGATVGAAVAIGPLVGGALTEWAGWRWIFFVNVPIGIACVAAALRVPARVARRGARRIRLARLRRSSRAASSRSCSRCCAATSWGWSSGTTVGLFAAAVVLLVCFVFAELRQKVAMFDLSLFRKPSFTAAQIVAFTISSSMFSMFLFFTLYLQNAAAPTRRSQAGLRFLPLSLLAFVAAPLAGRLSTRIPVRILLGVGMGLVGLALVLMHGLTPSSGWTTLLPGFLVGGLGIGLVNPALAGVAVGVVEPRRAGMASGINNTFRQVGIATGIAGLGAIFQSKVHGADRAAFVSGLNAILLVSAFVAFFGAVAAVALVRGSDFVRPQQQPQDAA